VHEPSTIHRYRELLEAHVLPTLGGRQLKALQPLELQALYDRLLIAGRRDGTCGWTRARSARAPRAARARKQAASWHLVARNVAGDLEPPKVPASAMVTLTAKQARELLEQAEGWLHTLVMLGVATGARRAQLLRLRWSEVNLDAGTVRIARSVVLVGGELH
jgi:integrase